LNNASLNNLIDISPFAYAVVLLYGTVLIKFLVSRWVVHEPLTFFTFYCEKLSNKVNKDKNTSKQRQTAGLISIFITLTPLVIILWLFEAFVEAAWVWQGLLLYIALGQLNLSSTCEKIAKHVAAKNSFSAKQLLSPWVKRDTEQLSALGLCKTTIEMQLLRSIQTLFTIGFYFLLFGPLFAFAIRLLIEMHYSWNIKQDKFRFFGRPIATIVNFIEWLPCRLFASMLLFGTIGRNFILFSRLSQRSFMKLNNGYALCILALSLDRQLGGVAMYQGNKLRRTGFNHHGQQPQASDVVHAKNKINNVFYFTFLALALFAVINFAINIK
jgi:adenosylcobinamide-phosphate synthase